MLLGALFYIMRDGDTIGVAIPHLSTTFPKWANELTPFHPDSQSSGLAITGYDVNTLLYPVSICKPFWYGICNIVIHMSAASRQSNCWGLAHGQSACCRWLFTVSTAEIVLWRSKINCCPLSQSKFFYWTTSIPLWGITWLTPVLLTPSWVWSSLKSCFNSPLVKGETNMTQ